MENNIGKNDGEKNNMVLPFDVYGSAAEYSNYNSCSSVFDGDHREYSTETSKFTSKSTAITVNSSKSNGTNARDEDDEENFIKIYFTSGTVLKPTQRPYDLRLKMDQANRQLQIDTDQVLPASVSSRVKFDNTVVVLDSFDDIGTVSVGTERLHGSDTGFEGAGEENGTVVAKVDLVPGAEEDDQNDVVVRQTSDKQTTDLQQQHGCTDADDKALMSSASFSRSFSSDSDDPPPFVNMIESGDEFETIMNKTKGGGGNSQGGPAIDEQVAYFPELFTHSQYKLYDNGSADGGKTTDDAEVNIYVPKKLDAEELRNRLKDVSKERRRRKPAEPAGKKNHGPRKSAAKKPDPGRPPPPPCAPPCDGKQSTKSAKFFHINLKAAKDGDGATADKTGASCKIQRPAKTPNADLFLEFHTDNAGNKGAKLVIKKKPTDCAKQQAQASASGGSERSRLPGYNGLRSEYGLSAEQLLERRRLKMDRERRRKEARQKRTEEEQRRRAENEKIFYKWLQQKRQQKKQVKARHSYPMSRLTVSSARTSIKSFDNGNYRKGSFALEELLKMKDDQSGWFKL
ncbi:uncharacterized protein LOC126843163 [Adelges cooleyi]|uniref:uncharacterized protein LOC126843163 n=1 Tax=Adelges cooleyi TaxID=133065 RepID=UPI00217F52C2|nr:uncharacterized protein LOC126843163 [Adelges cooleyi]